MNKENIKNFVINHEKGITNAIIIGGCVLSCFAGAAICNRINASKNLGESGELIIKILRDAREQYGENAHVIGGVCEQLGWEDLGKLGETMIQSVDVSDTTFTHFIAIGKPVELK